MVRVCQGLILILLCTVIVNCNFVHGQPTVADCYCDDVNAASTLTIQSEQSKALLKTDSTGKVTGTTAAAIDQWIDDTGDTMNGKMIHTESVDFGGTSCTNVISMIATPSVSATTYVSLNGFSSSATEADEQHFMIPVTMDFHNLDVKVVTAPGSSKNWVVTLRDDGADTTLACTVNDTDTSCNPGDTGSIEAAALSLMSISVVPSGTPTDSEAMRISLCSSSV